MPDFVKEERISDLAPGANCLVELAAVFGHRAQTVRPGDNDPLNQQSRPVYTIRCVDTVYKVFSPELLGRYFVEAQAVEKVTFQYESELSRRTNREQGEYLELSLEEEDPRQCYLAGGADDKSWIDDSFAAVQDVLAKCRKGSDHAREAWPRLALDVFGGALGVGISFWGATQLSPKLPVENSFWLSFFFTLLVFLTTWMIAEPQRQLRSSITFPNMRFRRDGKAPLPRLVQAIAGARGLLS